MRNTLVRSALLAAMLIAAASTSARAQVNPPCPSGVYQIGWGDSTAITGPSLSVSNPDGLGRARSDAFDLAHGTLSSELGDGGLAWTFVRATDLFDVTGVAAGTSVPVVAALDVDGYSQTSCLGFELYEFVAAGISGGGSGTARIRFSGVPAGMNVVSCEAYSLVTPVRARTWGALKSIYR
jgi:hypothetical protein